LLRIATDGVGIEKDIKDECVWLCFPCAVENAVGELGLGGKEGSDSRDYLGLLCERESIF
jgi:hypothetical protein